MYYILTSSITINKKSVAQKLKGNFSHQLLCSPNIYEENGRKKVTPKFLKAIGTGGGGVLCFAARIRLQSHFNCLFQNGDNSSHQNLKDVS